MENISETGMQINMHIQHMHIDIIIVMAVKNCFITHSPFSVNYLPFRLA